MSDIHCMPLVAAESAGKLQGTPSVLGWGKTAATERLIAFAKFRFAILIATQNGPTIYDVHRKIHGLLNLDILYASTQRQDWTESCTVWALRSINHIKAPVENYKLFLATAGFIEEELPLNAEYTDTLRTLFNTVCQPVHFRTEPSEAVQRINQFVENHTSGTIRDTLTSSDINADTAFILISSVYFEAEWDCRFFEEHTVKKPFNLADGSQVMVDTMHAMTRCRYYESKELGGARFLQLWYGEELSSACFILPGKNARSATWTPGSAMSDLQRALTPALLNKALDSLQPISYGTIQLPKFRIEHSIDMESTLQKLGMRSAFSRSADFSGISSRSLRIDKIKQKVYIDVNERGTVASATTLVRLKNCSLPPQTRVEFAADRPFMFLLRHEKTGTVLFIGHVMDPSAES
ncbi:serpin B10-like [Paramacrobiotus metropolitanus]|uniref:serpin B10-like n=1 Tax=Paramacrobiotus metropolitanus TaxID=2943436 RepID=UPI0024460540|nr:serpin B10-like [Paramacrobiotus metropolitanus]